MFHRIGVIEGDCFISSSREYIQQLNNFVSHPTLVHYQAACRVLKYMKGCPDRLLFFPRSLALQLFGFQKLIGLLVAWTS